MVYWFVLGEPYMNWRDFLQGQICNPCICKGWWRRGGQNPKLASHTWLPLQQNDIIG